MTAGTFPEPTNYDPTPAPPNTFRKRPVEITAVQLRWDTWSEMCAHAGVGPEPDQPKGTYIDENGYATSSVTDTIGMTVPTLEGVMLARQGDWVVKGTQGEIYPVKPEIFSEIYEQVSDSLP